jgi:K+-transporting ATPase ATPase C chain
MQEQKASKSALAHLRANLWLLILTLVIGCVLYPGVVWVVGQVFFHDKAEGSLVYQKVDGKDVAVGSTQIAQAFNSPTFFQPRPSAASYNGAASGASNLGASSPKLRGRVAQLLGMIARYSESYKKAHPKADGGEPSVQDDIVAWFKEQTAPTEPGKEKRDLFTEWATSNPTLAGAWATGTASIKDYVLQWAKDHPDVVEAWKKDNKDSPKTLDATDTTKKLGADDLAPYFFQSYEKEYFGKWPTQEALADVTAKIAAWAKDHPDVVKKWKAANPDAKEDPKDADLVAFFYQDYPEYSKDWPPLDPGEWVDADQKAVVKPDAQDSDVQSTFFDTWFIEQVKAKKLDPLKDFEQVPADMVMTSGSGLDPDISLRNARYQEDGVAAANVKQVIDAYESKNNTKATDGQKAKVEAAVRKAVDELLRQQAYRPMFGLTGDEQLINVLQLNLALKAKVEAIKVE